MAEFSSQPAQTYGSVTDKISAIVLRQPTSRRWYAGFGVCFALVLVLLYALAYLLSTGVGIWGVNVPVGWGFAIINFVWWIGIAHAGTLISAILLLLRQEWRTSVNRFAESMTLFAVACAAMFPLIHLGRPWLFYWLLPYSNTMGTWPQFRSPLVWDVFAIGTYATVSVLFWFMGLLPDLASLRDRAGSRPARIIYGLLAMGWRGSAVHWHRYETAYLLLAGLATPLVISVHTVVSFDFAVSIIPGWHSTIFPPYFVAGAIFAGFAMLLTLAIPVRALYGLKEFITTRHLDNMAKILLAMGLLVAYGYVMEAFMAWYGGSPYEQQMVLNRIRGPDSPLFWALMVFNVVLVQPLWSGRVRRNLVALFSIAMSVNIGMWLERYIIVVTSLHRDFLPSSWGMFSGTLWDWATLAGSIGLFLSMLFLFIRFLPVISMAEVRAQLPAGFDERQRDSSGHRGTRRPPEVLHGVMAEFGRSEELVSAARRSYEEGYRRLDAFSPFPIPGLAAAIGRHRGSLPWVVLASGILGGLAGFILQYWVSVIELPVNVGGRPLNSWPAFIPVTFECAVLGAALGAVLGMLVLNGLPRPHHPVFNEERFALASRHRFFLCIEAGDAHFDRRQVADFLRSLGPVEVMEVES